MLEVSPEDVQSGKITFERRWRGFDPDQVDPLLRAAEQAAFSDDAASRAEMADRLETTEFRVVRRGYDREAVLGYRDALVRDYLRGEEPPQPSDAVPEHPGFMLTLRGYDPQQVDALIFLAEAAIRSGDQHRQVEALAALRDGQFQVVMRGYDRQGVHAHLADLISALE